MKDKDEFLLGVIIGALGLLFVELLLLGLYGLVMAIVSFFH